MINNDILGTKNIELKIYFMKLRADYFRYWSSVASDDKFFSKSSIKFHFFFSSYVRCCSMDEKYWSV